MSLRTFNVKRYRSVKLETFAEKLLHERNQPGLTAHLHVRNKLTACWQTVLRDINVNTVTMETAQKHIFKHDVFGFSRGFLLSPLQARQTTPTQPVRIVSKSTLKNSHTLPACVCSGFSAVLYFMSYTWLWWAWLSKLPPFFLAVCDNAELDYLPVLSKYWYHDIKF